MQFVVQQKILGPRVFLACLLFINTTFILAIDLYVPALPGLVHEFETTSAVLNLTMFSFMFVSAFAMVFAGPLSDKAGRRPVLIASCVIFALSSAGCALSGSVAMLTVFRIGQAIGYGFVATVATSMIKDAYSDEDLKIAMSLMQSLIIAGPVVAPFLGTFILSVGGWRFEFWVLAALGVLDLMLSLLVSETITAEQRLRSGVLLAMADMVSRVRGLLSKRFFTTMSFLVAFAGAPFLGFIAVASYILLDGFGLDYMTYSLIYAGLSIESVVAPFIYLAISKRLGTNAITILCIALGFVSGVLTFAFGSISPMAFFLCFMAYPVMEGIIRPHGFVMLLDQPPEQVGSASAFINFIYSVLSSLGTIAMTLPWPSYIGGLGVTMCASCMLMVGMYVLGARRG